MAITIDDIWFGDPRRKNLVKQVGEEPADGIALNMWRIAFGYNKRKSMIPKDVFWLIPYAKEFLSHGLAVEHDDGVYIKGSRDRFAWFHEAAIEKRESASNAGKVSAQRPRDEKGRLKPKQIQAESIKTPTKVQRESNASNDVQRDPTESNTLQPSLILSNSILSKNLETKGEVATSLDPPKVKNPVGYFIGAYIKAFEARYKTRPDLEGKVAGQIKNFLKNYPVDKAIELIQAYLQMNGKNNWYVTKGHDFTTFMENLNPIQIALSAGRESSTASTLRAEDLT